MTNKKRTSERQIAKKDLWKIEQYVENREEFLSEVARHCISLAAAAYEQRDDEQQVMLNMFFGAAMVLGRTAMSEIHEDITKREVLARGLKEIANRVYHEDPKFISIVHSLVKDLEK